jgi:nucleoside-diphosphate-sugar epimerase
MARTRTAAVVGALGVIGRYVVERLTRRSEADRPGYRHLAVDLLDPDALSSHSTVLSGVTHIFYAAFQASSGAAAGYASNIAPNRDMLVNAVSGIARTAPQLERVVLVTGTKYYGSHLGPYRTPARETDPRHMPPNYYFDQIDWLTQFQKGKSWDWVELRPQPCAASHPARP